MSTNGRSLPDDADPATVLDAVRSYIEYQQSTGLEALPRQSARPRVGAVTPPTLQSATTRTQSARDTAAPAVTPSAPAKVAAPASNLIVDGGARQAGSLEALRAEIGDCQRCKLCRGRTNIVFGVGNPNADLMFVGEGPGRDEDLKAEPFVGRAGQLLTEIITKGMKLRREDVYIANVIKCRPPENRNPEPDEIAACQPFLLRQIELIRPRVIVALGTFAAQTLLGQRTPISRLRGTWFDYHGVKLMPTLHPAYLLRNPNDKRLVWEDIKMAMRELERPA